jgi:hypothetical protein
VCALILPLARPTPRTSSADQDCPCHPSRRAARIGSTAHRTYRARASNLRVDPVSPAPHGAGSTALPRCRHARTDPQPAGAPPPRRASLEFAPVQGIEPCVRGLEPRLRPAPTGIRSDTDSTARYPSRLAVGCGGAGRPSLRLRDKGCLPPTGGPTGSRAKASSVGRVEL